MCAKHGQHYGHRKDACYVKVKTGYCDVTVLLFRKKTVVVYRDMAKKYLQ